MPENDFISNPPEPVSGPDQLHGNTSEPSSTEQKATRVTSQTSKTFERVLPEPISSEQGIGPVHRTTSKALQTQGTQEEEFKSAQKSLLSSATLEVHEELHEKSQKRLVTEENLDKLSALGDPRGRVVHVFGLTMVPDGKNKGLLPEQKISSERTEGLSFLPAKTPSQAAHEFLGALRQMTTECSRRNMPLWSQKDDADIPDLLRFDDRFNALTILQKAFIAIGRTKWFDTLIGKDPDCKMKFQELFHMLKEGMRTAHFEAAEQGFKIPDEKPDPFSKQNFESLFNDTPEVRSVVTSLAPPETGEPNTSLCGMLKQLGSNKKLSLTENGLQLIDRQPNLLSFLMSRTGHTTKAAQTASKTFRELEDLYLKVKGDPQQELELQDALLDLGASEWFHGVLHHHPEIAHEFVKTVGKIFPSPAGDDLGKWMELGAKTAGTKASKLISEHIAGVSIQIAELTNFLSEAEIARSPEKLKQAKIQIDDYYYRNLNTLSKEKQQESKQLKDRSDKLFLSVAIPSYRDRLKEAIHLGDPTALLNLRAEIDDLYPNKKSAELTQAFKELDEEWNIGALKFSNWYIKVLQSSHLTEVHEVSRKEMYLFYPRLPAGSKRKVLSQIQPPILESDCALMQAKFHRIDVSQAIERAFDPSVRERALITDPSEATKKDVQAIVKGRPYDLTRYAKTRSEFVDVLEEMAKKASGQEARALVKFVQNWADDFNKLPLPLKDEESFLREKEEIHQKINMIAQTLSEKTSTK